MLNLLPTPSCLLPVQFAGVKCQKMEINISNDGLNQNFLPVTIYYFGKLRIELQTLNYYVFDPIPDPHPLANPSQLRAFLAHLSRRLTGELIGYPWIRRPASSSVRPSTFSNIFSSETAWPIKAKFYMEPPWEGRTKVCINGPGHMTKMAAMPIYGKNPSKIFFSRTGGPISTKLGM